MILDAENRYSNAQDLFADGPGPGTVVSTDVIDGGTAGDAEDELYLVVDVETTFTSGGAATLTVSLETDDNSGFSSATVKFTSAVFALASLTAGSRLAAVRLPKGMERFSRVSYAIGTAALTAGKVDAHLALDIDHQNKTF